MDGNCLVPSSRAIDEVLKQAGPNKIAMFRVVSAPSSVPDQILGESVYVHNDKIYNFMHDKHTSRGLQAAENLHFMRYVDEANIN